MEFSIGEQALRSGASALNSELSRVNYGPFRRYFDVTDSYILQKLLLITVPFYFKEDPTSNSLYRPDMYIPAMSIITHMLVKGFLLGLINRFHPEVLGVVFTRSILIHIAVCLLYKTASYFSNASVDIKDLLCFAGYKFLVVILVKICKLIPFGSVISLYFFVAYFFFLSRSLKGSITSSNSPKAHLYLLFGIASLDVVILFLMS